MSHAPLTPSQTVGPFFHPALLRADAPTGRLVTDETEGERVRIEGRVLDGDGEPVADALIDLWQANAFGRYRHPADGRDVPLDPAFTGYGRTGTDDGGRYWFETIRPGRVPYEGGRMQAAHLSLTVIARGLLNHLFTRLYFADDPATADDPILLRVPEPRRGTLLAAREERDGRIVYTFDIVLQGERQTAFLNPNPALPRD